MMVPEWKWWVWFLVALGGLIFLGLVAAVVYLQFFKPSERTHHTSETHVVHSDQAQESDFKAGKSLPGGHRMLDGEMVHIVDKNNHLVKVFKSTATGLSKLSSTSDSKGSLIAAYKRLETAVLGPNASPSQIHAVETAVQITQDIGYVKRVLGLGAIGTVLTSNCMFGIKQHAEHATKQTGFDILSTSSSSSASNSVRFYFVWNIVSGEMRNLMRVQVNLADMLHGRLRVRTPLIVVQDDALKVDVRYPSTGHDISFRFDKFQELIAWVQNTVRPVDSAADALVNLGTVDKISSNLSPQPQFKAVFEGTAGHYVFKLKISTECGSFRDLTATDLHAPGTTTPPQPDANFTIDMTFQDGYSYPMLKAALGGLLSIPSCIPFNADDWKHLQGITGIDSNGDC